MSKTTAQEIIELQKSKGFTGFARPNATCVFWFRRNPGPDVLKIHFNDGSHLFYADGVWSTEEPPQREQEPPDPNKVYLTWSPPSHEGEYVICFADFPGDEYQRYEWLKQTVLESGFFSPTRDVSNRRTRLEITGPRNDGLFKAILRSYGYKVIE